MHKIKNKLNYPWALYTFMFLILISIFTVIFFLTGKSLIWSQDGMAQHFPILIDFRQHILDWITHPSFDLSNWSTNIGLGADQLTSFSYYVTGDLFNYLIILFPKQQLELGYAFLIILRLYCSGLAFILYAKLFTRKKFSLAIGALVFTFSSYSMLIGMHHPFFILSLIFLPLLFYGIEKALHNKTLIPLTVSVLLTFIGNFYFAYILGITCVFYFIIRFISLYPSIKKKCLKITIKITGSVVTGILLSGIILIPTLIFVLNSTRTNSEFANGYLFYPLNYYLSIPAQLLSFGNNYNFWLLLGFSGISFISVTYTMIHFKKYWPLNISLILIGLGTLFPFVGAIFNAFSTPSNRWTLIAILPLSLATVFFLNHLFRLNKKDLNIIVTSIASLLLISFITQGGIKHTSATQYFTYLLIIILIISIYLSRDNLWSHHKLNFLVASIVILNLAILGNDFFNPNESKWSNQQLDRDIPTNYIKDYYNGADNYVKNHLGNYQTSIGANYHNVNNPSNFLNTNSNISLVKDTKEITSYLSTENGYLGRLSNQLQNNQSSLNTPVAQGDYRTSLLNILGVKYLFIHENQLNKAAPFGFKPVKINNKIKVFKTPHPFIKNDDNQGTILLENKNPLPLLYSQNSIIDQNIFNQLNPIDREQALIQGASLKHKINGIKSSKMNKASKNINYSVQMDTSKTIDSIDKVNQLRIKNKNVSNNLPNKNYAHNHKVKNIIKENKDLIKRTKIKNSNGLKSMTTDNLGHQMSFFLKVKNPNQIKNKELYLVVDDVKSNEFTAHEQIKMRNKIYTLNNLSNPLIDQIQSFRKNLFHTFNGNYKFTASTNGFKNGFTQYGNDNLSNYQKIHNKVINLGYYRDNRKKIEVKFNGVKNLNFKKVQLVAVDFNKNYQKQINKIQKNKFENIKVKNNKITGISHQSQKSVMTTRIPYSSGWKLTIDGKPTKTKLVNQGFIGAVVPSGKHKIKLTYQTPGIIIGCISTLIGILIIIISLIYIPKSKKN
ncbi:YfhO family protein [Lactobacillus sp. S2-2]|uniref:YfhO family protein n=1 Tax=Lactobacillus sp. S2-2 TaxID=2692917 RepID=UPI001F308925|nr:YfhO family protein [Lactobacillus sp. S2-2]MCF6515299.1 YfhO family protein [Lactobacillus sp. S2-2]